VLAIDARSDGSGGWEVWTHGGRNETGIDAVQWAAEGAARGAGEILLTSMDRDGTKTGYDVALLQAVRQVVPVPVIASGGAGTTNDMVVAFTDGSADAVLAASIFHYGAFSVGDVKDDLVAAGVSVRQDSGLRWP
jgi:cyclase